ncbi:hypothetical protein Sfr7A_21250 [Streptomyces xinghaiensis]|uniref:Uncharacterized protein n=1 Tax=Streptomyces xinghaiensis TaxID=1038928 RepID=A0A3R7IR19_9ACTN|nr:hypothetical protein Sfr7A_21250 [Streptomyces xinghaiensis]RKM94352.1 hypothetical protein SFRA_017825 [Streptomyces xinghaiensis]RNC71952.1 hypothetical protein DC095_020025 [Streptomyces xinghaiensis]
MIASGTGHRAPGTGHRAPGTGHRHRAPGGTGSRRPAPRDPGESPGATGWGAGGGRVPPGGRRDGHSVPIIRWIGRTPVSRRTAAAAVERYGEPVWVLRREGTGAGRPRRRSCCPWRAAAPWWRSRDGRHRP